MQETDYTENLFRAIDTIVAERIRSLPYDITEIVEIIDDKYAESGLYTVSSNNQFKENVYSDNPDYQKGDKVYLLKVAGSERRFIIGLYQNNKTGRISNNIQKIRSRIEIEKYLPYNYVNTLEPVKTSSSSGRNNAVVLDDGSVKLSYREDVNTYFTLQLNEILLAKKQYTLSFVCSGVNNLIKKPSFFLKSNSKILVDKLELHEGKNIISFIPSLNTSLSILFDDSINSIRPINSNIILSNFQVEEGKTISNYTPSIISIENEIKRIESLTRAYKNTNNWSIGLIDESFVYASKNSSQTININNANTNFYSSDIIYMLPPYPMETLTMTGGCNKNGLYISNINTDIRDAIIGVSFNVCAPSLINNITVKSNLQLSGLTKTPALNPTFQYNSQIGQQIINIAQTYVDSQTNSNNQKYSYGKNFFYNNCNYIYLIKDNINYARVECDTYAGLVLRGIPYEKSPFKSGNITNTIQEIDSENNTFLSANGLPTGMTLYDKIMSDTENNLPIWAQEMRKKIKSSTNPDVKNYLEKDARWASTHGWLFWTIPGTIFSNEDEAKPGDVAFFCSPQKAEWFDAITHIAIVGPRDAEGYLTIYEVTGSVESGGRILQHVSLKHRTNAKIAYFARPYGWY